MPVLLRKCKAQRHLEVGFSVRTSPALPEDHYKAIYMEVVNTAITCITDRFAQDSYQMYSKVDRLFVEQDQTENEVAEILTHL